MISTEERMTQLEEEIYKLKARLWEVENKLEGPGFQQLIKKAEIQKKTREATEGFNLFL